MAAQSKLVPQRKDYENRHVKTDWPPILETLWENMKEGNYDKVKGPASNLCLFEDGNKPETQMLRNWLRIVELKKKMKESTQEGAEIYQKFKYSKKKMHVENIFEFGDQILALIQNKPIDDQTAPRSKKWSWHPQGKPTPKTGQELQEEIEGHELKDKDFKKRKSARQVAAMANHSQFSYKRDRKGFNEEMDKWSDKTREHGLGRTLHHYSKLEENELPNRVVNKTLTYLREFALTKNNQEWITALQGLNKLPEPEDSENEAEVSADEYVKQVRPRKKKPADSEPTKKKSELVKKKRKATTSIDEGAPSKKANIVREEDAEEEDDLV